MRHIIMIVTVLLVFVSINHLRADQNAVLVYTNSLNGRLDYCHCVENPNGGLVKRGTVFAELRKKYPSALFLDAGDFMLYEKDAILMKYLVAAYQHLSYDAIVCGDQEFINGTSSALNLSKKLPLLCNNLQVQTSGGFIYPFKRSLVIKKGGLTIGIIGSMGEGTFKFYDKSITSKIKLDDQVAAIKGDIATLQKHAPDLVVLLSHSGHEKDKKIAEIVQGIDVIIGGHTQLLLEQPYYNGRTIIVQAGMNGAHIGVLELLRHNGKTKKFKNTFILPDDKKPVDDPIIRKLITEYNLESKESSKDLKFD